MYLTLRAIHGQGKTAQADVTIHQRETFLGIATLMLNQPYTVVLPIAEEPALHVRLPSDFVKILTLIEDLDELRDSFDTSNKGSEHKQQVSDQFRREATTLIKNFLRAIGDGR